MPYANTQDIIDRYGEDFLFTLADRDRDDDLDTTAVDNALSDASGLMDSYLSTRFALPLENMPALLKRLCIDIAVYWLSEDGGGATEEKRQRYEDTIAWLKRISKGETELGLGSDSKGSTDDGDTASSDGVLIQSNERLFSRNKLRGW